MLRKSPIDAGRPARFFEPCGQRLHQNQPQPPTLLLVETLRPLPLAAKPPPLREHAGSYALRPHASGPFPPLPRLRRRASGARALRAEVKSLTAGREESQALVTRLGKIQSRFPR